MWVTVPGVGKVWFGEFGHWEDGVGTYFGPLWLCNDGSTLPVVPGALCDGYVILGKLSVVSLAA